MLVGPFAGVFGNRFNKPEPCDVDNLRHEGGNREANGFIPGGINYNYEHADSDAFLDAISDCDEEQFFDAMSQPDVDASSAAMPKKCIAAPGTQETDREPNRSESEWSCA